MKPTDHTHGPDDETPNQKRERESRERINRQYAEQYGFPVPGSGDDVFNDLEDNATEQGQNGSESTPEHDSSHEIDLDVVRGNVHKKASDILQDGDSRIGLDSSDSGMIWLSSDSDSDIPVARPVGSPDSDPEFDYTASSSTGGNGGGGRGGDDDDRWTMDDSDDDDTNDSSDDDWSADDADHSDDTDDDTISFDDEESENTDEFEDSEDTEDDEDDEDVEDDEDDENDYHDDEDDSDDDDEVEQPSPGILARAMDFLRGDPTRRWGDSLPKWMKQPPMANAAGILTSLPIAKTVGNILLNGVAAGAPLATYIGLPVASSGSLLVSVARTSRGQDNAKRRQEEEPISDTDLLEIRQALSLNEGGDLIDTAEEQNAAQVVDRLGVLKVKTFPLCGSDEEYAQEVYRRIHPVLSRGTHHDGDEEPELEHEGVPGGCPERWSEKKKEKIRKQLRSQKLYDAYVQLLADAHHGEEHAEHADDEGGDDHGHGKSLKALTESQIKQVSVQLGRMMYNRHLAQNHFGRAFGLAGAAVLGTMTGTIVPFAIAGGIEGGRELYRRYRVNKSHLRYDLKGNIVNTKDGKDILVLPPEKKIEEEHEDHRTHEEKAHDLAEAKKKKESASEKCEKLTTEIRDLEVKIETDHQRREELIAEIEEIVRKSKKRTITPEQKREKEKCESDLRKIDVDSLILDRENLLDQKKLHMQKIEKADKRIEELEISIAELEAKIGDTSVQQDVITQKRNVIAGLKLDELLDEKDALEQRQKKIPGRLQKVENDMRTQTELIQTLEKQLAEDPDNQEKKETLQKAKSELASINTAESIREEADKLELEHKKLVRKIENAQSVIEECKKIITDIERKLSEGFYDAALVRQIQEKKAAIERINRPGLTVEMNKIERAEQGINLKIKKAEEERVTLIGKIRKIENDVVMTELNDTEMSAINAKQKEIGLLKIDLSINKKARLDADLVKAKENKKTVDAAYTKELEASRKHHEEKEDGFWKKSTKFIFASNPVQTALNFTKDVAIHGTAGAVGGAVIGSFIGVPGWGATLVGGWVAGKYLVNRLTGTASNPHPKVDVHHDTAHGKKDDHGHAKKDDHKADTHH